MYSEIRRQTILVFLAITLVSVADAQQDDAICGIANSVLEQFDWYDAVLLGSVVRVRRSLSSNQLAIDVAVEQAWKGVSGTTVGMLLVGRVDGVEFGGVDLEVGDQRVFYLSKWNELPFIGICTMFELPPRETILGPNDPALNDPDEFLRLGIEPVEPTVGDDPVYPPIDDPMFVPVDDAAPVGYVCPLASVALFSFGALRLARRNS